MGRILTEETKRKISESRKGKGLNNRARLGMIPWNKGKKRTEEDIKKQKATRKENLLSGKTKPSRYVDGRSYNKEFRSWQKNERNRKKRLAKGTHTFGDWQTLKAQYNFTCPCCYKPDPEIKLTEDHIIPISKGGSDNIENIQPLCKKCNCKKMTRIIKY